MIRRLSRRLGWRWLGPSGRDKAEISVTSTKAPSLDSLSDCCSPRPACVAFVKSRRSSVTASSLSRFPARLGMSLTCVRLRFGRTRVGTPAAPCVRQNSYTRRIYLLNILAACPPYSAASTMVLDKTERAGSRQKMANTSFPSVFCDYIFRIMMRLMPAFARSHAQVYHPRTAVSLAELSCEEDYECVKRPLLSLASVPPESIASPVRGPSARGQTELEGLYIITSRNI